LTVTQLVMLVLALMEPEIGYNNPCFHTLFVPRSTLILSSHICLSQPSGLFPSINFSFPCRWNYFHVIFLSLIQVMVWVNISSLASIFNVWLQINT